MHGEASIKVEMSYNEVHDGELAMVKKLKFGSTIGCQGNIPHVQIISSPMEPFEIQLWI